MGSAAALTIALGAGFNQALLTAAVLYVLALVLVLSPAAVERGATLSARSSPARGS
jgi:hypothetical protein